MVTIAMNIGFDGQLCHNSHVGFDSQYGHDSHIDFDGQGGYDSHKCRFQYPGRLR